MLIVSCSEHRGNKDDYSSNSNKGTLNDPNIYQGSRMYGSNPHDGLVIHNNSQLRYSRELSNKVGHLPGVRAALVMLTDRNAYTAILIDNASHRTLGPNSKKETNNTGTSIGTYNPDTLNEMVENWQLASGTNNYETVQNHEDIASVFKQKIAITLRAAQPKIHNVYISANRDFINQLTAYAIESDWGNKSLNNRIDEFNGTANRIFGVPEAIIEIRK
jgi:hypothetical protein